jgi:hypothetical protein
LCSWVTLSKASLSFTCEMGITVRSVPWGWCED